MAEQGAELQSWPIIRRSAERDLKKSYFILSREFSNDSPKYA